MSEFVKVLDYNSIDARGESTIRFLHPSFKMVKTADSMVWAPKIQDFIANLKPVADKLYALINAMGATEFYGPNRNGDGFYESVLRKFHPSFVDHGNPYMHHLNKDPAKAYGKVLLSDYNDVMHRVELIVEYDTTKLDRKYVEKISNGDMVQVSMGCRVPYDICSICGNRAKAPAAYCEHLKSNPGLNKMMPDGRRAFAINTEPEFFDISIVTIPADPTACVLMKLAQQTCPLIMSSDRAKQEFKTEKAAFTVTSDSTKPVEDIDPSIVPLTDEFNRAMGSDIPKEVLDMIGMSNSDPLQILKGFIDSKTMLRPPEIQRIVLVSCGKSDLADKLDSAKIVLNNDPSSVIPSIMNSIPDMDPLNFLPRDTLQNRSMEPGNIRRIIIRMSLAPHVKEASMVNVDVSDDYRYLAGDKGVREGLPSVVEEPGDAIKTYLALGSVIAAVQTLLGYEVTPKTLASIGLLSILAGPQMIAAINNPSQIVNTPPQQMQFLTPDSPEAVEYSLKKALEQVNYQNAMRDRISRERMSSLKLGAAHPYDDISHLGFKSLLSLPLAYGISKIASDRAKSTDSNSVQFTAVPAPQTESPLPVSRALLAKYASAQKRVDNYVKTAENKLGRPFAEIYRHNKEDIYKSVEKILFK